MLILYNLVVVQVTVFPAVSSAQEVSHACAINPDRPSHNQCSHECAFEWLVISKSKEQKYLQYAMMVWTQLIHLPLNCNVLSSMRRDNEWNPPKLQHLRPWIWAPCSSVICPFNWKKRVNETRGRESVLIDCYTPELNSVILKREYEYGHLIWLISPPRRYYTPLNLFFNVSPTHDYTCLFSYNLFQLFTLFTLFNEIEKASRYLLVKFALAITLS